MTILYTASVRDMFGQPFTISFYAGDMADAIRWVNDAGYVAEKIIEVSATLKRYVGSAKDIHGDTRTVYVFDHTIDGALQQLKDAGYVKVDIMPANF